MSSVVNDSLGIHETLKKEVYSKNVLCCGY